MDKTSADHTGYYILFLILISLLSSHIAYQYIEEPMRKWLRKKAEY